MKAVIALACLLSVFAWAADAPKCTPADNMRRIAESFKEMEAVRVGMKREDLLKVFTPQAGFFSVTRGKGTYVYKGSPYIKVDVEFAPTDAVSNGPERPDDVITSISRPYLGEPVFD
jgi:hypothetical protein